MVKNPARFTRASAIAIIVILLVGGCSLGSKSKSEIATSIPVSTADSTVSSSQFNPVETGSPVATAGISPTAQTPKPTGQQVLTLSGGPLDPSTLDPALIRDAESAFIARQIFRGLVKLSPDLKPVPDLAATIDVSADQMTYTFHLRDGLKFSGGTPIHASDVQYSLNRSIDPALASQAGGSLPALTFLSDIAGSAERAAGKTDQISGIQVVDDLTLRIQLTHAVADFLVKLAGTPASVVNRNNVQSGSNWWRSPDASGPFRVSKWSPGEQMVLTANPRYLPEPPTLKSVIVLFGANAAQPFTLYERHQVDIAGVPADAVDRVQASNSPYRNQLSVQPLLSTSYILLNPNIAPFDDINFRKALIMAFDRTKIATVTYDGHVDVANSIVPAGLQGIDWSANLPSYDPAGAKALLQQTSVANGGTGVVLYTSGEYAPIAMKLQLEKNLSIKADVVQLDWPDYINDIGAHTLPAVTLSWIADYPDPEDFLRVLFYSTSSENIIGYHNKEVDKLLDEALSEPDLAKRSALYKQAQQRIIDDAVVIPLYSDVEYELIEPYVHGLQLSPVGILGLESVWITK